MLRDRNLTTSRQIHLIAAPGTGSISSTPPVGGANPKGAQCRFRLGRAGEVALAAATLRRSASSTLAKIAVSAANAVVGSYRTVRIVHMPPNNPTIASTTEAST